MQLSLVIPAYNESHRIEETLRHVEAYLREQSYDSEVLVVDDGSTDGTGELVRAGFPKVKVLRHEPNRGKGYSVKSGMTAAQGAYRVFYDADASTPAEELAKLWPLFEAGADIVIGSRALPDSNIEIRQSWHRENMGRVFNTVLRTMSLTPFKDTQCGFKAFSAAACEAVFPRQSLNGFSFDAELLFIALRHGLRVEEIPITWRNCPHTSLRLGHHSAQMFWELLAVRWRAWQGAYD